MAQALFARALTDEERRLLEAASESGNKEEAWRAKVVLLSARRKTAPAISAELGYHQSNVKKWIRKFNDDGLDGLAVRKRGPRRGPKSSFTKIQIEQILKLAQADPQRLGFAFKNWTPQKLASAAIERRIVERISHVTIRQVLLRNGVNVNRSGPNPVTGEAVSPNFALGEDALNRCEFERAAELLSRSLSDDRASDEQEAITRSLLCRALEELSRYDEAYEAVRKYEDPVALSSLSLKTKAMVKLRLGWANGGLRRNPEAIAALNEAKKLFLEIGDEVGLSRVHYALGHTYERINEFKIARDHLVTAAGFERVAVDSELMAGIYDRLGAVDHYEGSFSRAKENGLRALEFARGTSNSNLIGKILLNLGTFFDEGNPGQRDESAGNLRAAIGHLEKGGHKDFLAFAYNNLGDLLRFSGLWDEAIENLNKAIDVAQLLPKPNYECEATARITLAEILCVRGRLTEAEENLKRSLDLIEGTGDKWLESAGLRVLASVHRGKNRVELALRELRQSLRLATSIGDLHGVTVSHIGLADLHLSQGGIDQAREYVELAQERLKEEESLYISGLVQRLNGRVAAESGRLAEARHHVAQSISIFSKTEIMYELARSHFSMALVLDKIGDSAAVGKHLLQARDMFQSLGADPELDLVAAAIESASLFEKKSGLTGPAPNLPVRTASSNPALLMQRLIEASGSRDLLLDELTSVVFENFPVRAVAILSGADGASRVLASRGIDARDSELVEAAGSANSVEIEDGAKSGELCVAKLGSRSESPVLFWARPAAGFNADHLLPLFKQADLGLEMCSLRTAARVPPVERPLDKVHAPIPGFIVASPAMVEVLEKIHKIKTSDVTVLITGESGTGKELVARAVHAGSARARAIFLPFNCTATPKDIIDSQLFGHKRGSFTGATTDYTGLIRAAEGGTLFLDEIGDLALEIQPKLMRFLQEGEIQPIGHAKPIKVDVRVIAATNTDLERAVAERRFREDLFHRLNIIRIHVPPLRERRDEIPVLAAHFVEHFSTRSGSKGIRLTTEAIEALTGYSWPGNVRQLRNEIERVMAYASEGASVAQKDLSPEVANAGRARASTMPTGRPFGADGDVIDVGFAMASGSEPRVGSGGSSLQFGNFETGSTQYPAKYRSPHNSKSSPNLKERVAELERQLIVEALARNKNNLSRTAAEVGLSRRGLRLKLGQLGIARDSE
jgi:DNA-binding NtrC family response regulator/tetratricopeptide (TPR) repeat protein